MDKLGFFDLPEFLRRVANVHYETLWYTSANCIVSVLWQTKHKDLYEILRGANHAYVCVGKGGSITREHYALICDEEWVDELMERVNTIMQTNKNHAQEINH